MSGPPREAQSIFPIKLTKTDEVDLAKNNKVVGGSRLSVLPNIDPNPSNVSHESGLATALLSADNQLVMAGVLHMSTTGKVGILGRLEPNKDAKLCRMTIRSTNEDVSAEILRLTAKPLNMDTAAS